MTSLAEAQRIVRDACSQLGTTELTLDAALGFVVADEVVASEPIPPFDNTAMDGFALRASDTAAAPSTLQVIGTIAAGAPLDGTVGPGQAARIMTGAPIPLGADAIAQVEITRAGPDGSVVIESTVPRGEHVRRAGSDLAPGSVVLPVSTELTPGALGVLASLGSTTVTVWRRPVVGVLSTGNELAEGGAALGPGQIRDANRPSLAALVRQSGFEAIDLGIARDSLEEIESAFRAGLSRCDALLSTGGVSVGDFDYTKAVLDRLSGGSMRWMQVDIRPARPLAFGLVDGTPVFGLPGNPVSCLVSFECFARPALRKMAGYPGDALDRPRFLAVADEGFPRRPDGKLHLLRSRADPQADGRIHVHSTGGQSSHQLLAMAKANALALVPDGDGIAPGGQVQTILLGL